MKIFFEEYHYPKDVVKGNIENHFISPLKNNDKVKIPYVGYLYSKDVGDTVFVLPKVFINKEGKAFGEFLPEDIIDTNDEKNELLKSKYFEEVFNLSTWIYRAIARYKEECPEENISEIVDILDVESNKGSKSITWIEIILRLVRFAKEHQNLFTFIARMNSQGQNKIHWNKTINRVVLLMQDDTPIYMRFINKKKTINFDEELLVLFYSVLEYLRERYHFKIVRNINYPVDTRWIQRLINCQKGTRLLRSIRKKYFKDELVELWNLLYMFFERSQHVAGKSTHEEALMIRNFNLVFEAMIDALISDDTKQKRSDLKDQPDGKIVDHIYRYESLMNREDEIFYIGDSKYYQEKNEEGENSIFKQFTYAKNVIQMNMDWTKGRIGRDSYFDKTTEGYNITPNFFIRGIVNTEKFSFTDKDLEVIKTDGVAQFERKAHHKNRLFDRDTLFVQKYNINFLYVLSAYATHMTDSANKGDIHKKFKDNIMNWLNNNYAFYILKKKNGKVLQNIINNHFRLLLGKIYAYDEGSVILGLEPDDVNSLVGINDAVKLDFDIYEYDILKAEVGDLFTGPKLPSIYADMQVFEIYKAWCNNSQSLGITDEMRGELREIIQERFGEKYWGMKVGDWFRLVKDVKMIKPYAANIDTHEKVADGLHEK